jgi:hypothetical protein
VAGKPLATRFQLTDLERHKLLLAAERELRDAKLGLSPGSRFAIAYNAALRLCTVALATAGFRASRDQKHYRAVPGGSAAAGAWEPQFPEGGAAAGARGAG